MKGIAGVVIVGGVSFLAIVWFFFIRPTQTAVTKTAVAHAPQGSGDNAASVDDKPTAKDQAVLFGRTALRDFNKSNCSRCILLVRLRKQVDLKLRYYQT